MFGLITDRDQSNVDRLKALSAKGWDNMTPAEKAEWSGNPLTAADFGYDSAVNLMSNGPYYSSSVALTYKRNSITATTNQAGIYLYAVSIIGDAADYEGKTFTFSVGDMYSDGGGTPQLALYWHDDNGYEAAGATLTSKGSLTFTVTENTENRAYLAAYVYVTTDQAVSGGAYVRYSEVMLELGSERHGYVPYAAVLPTPATKGAYNCSDMNRVEMAVAELADLFGVNVVTKTDWGLWDKPNQEDLSRYLANIEAIREVCPEAQNLQMLPRSMVRLHYTTANIIEQILLTAYESVHAHYRCGELYCGEV